MSTPQQTPDSGVVPEFHIGDRMAKALDHAGIGRAEMAEFMDVSTETLRRWTSNLTPIKRSTLRLWAMRTGVALEWLETGQAPTQSSGPATKLPRLDSNQQPSGYRFALVSEPCSVVDLDAERLSRRRAS